MTLQYVTSEHETLEFGRLIPKILNMGTISWQNATYTIQFILTIYINSEKHIARKMRSCWIFQLKVRKIEKNSKKWLPRSYLTIQNKLV